MARDTPQELTAIRMQLHEWISQAVGRERGHLSPRAPGYTRNGNRLQGSHRETHTARQMSCTFQGKRCWKCLAQGVVGVQ